MEQRVRENRPALSRRPRRLALLLALALAGCSSAVFLYSGQSSKRAASSQRPPMVTSIAPRASAVSAPRAIELAQFAPLAAEPEFRKIAELVEADEYALAADELDRARADAAAPEAASLALWAGRLWERADEPTRALAACEAAARVGYELEDYARLCAARALIALSRPGDALKALDSPSFTKATENERAWLQARALRATGDWRAASGAYRLAAALASDTAERTRIEIELAETLLSTEPTDASAAAEAVPLLRRASATLAADAGERARLAGLEARALASLPPSEQRALAQPSLDERVLEIRALVDARDFTTAEQRAAQAVSTLPESARYEKPACELRLLQGKALSGARRSGAALDALGDARKGCAIYPDLGARIFYLSGRYAAADGQKMPALAFYGEVEKRFASDTLADDARFQAALIQEDLGVEARATELLLSLADDYPAGDMAPEALFRLALKRMDRGSWSDALGLLERGIALLGDRDRARGFDLAGRERFFRARALLALGQRSPALQALTEIVQSLPLSYYMLEAYTWLEHSEPGRAPAAVSEAEARALAEPFHVAGRVELERPGFSRMMELLRISELDAAVRELDVLGLRKDGVGSEILWGVALLYERAGFSKFSQALARRRLADVTGRWPVAEWARAWQIAFPRPYLEIVQREANRAGIETSLAYAIMREESAFDPDAVSPANAYGLMQLIVPTARSVAKRLNLPSGPSALRRPRINVALGCHELARLSGMFTDNPLLAVPAYNAGPARCARWLRDRPSMDFDLWVESIPFLETRRYTKRVLASRAVYAYLYERESAAEHLLLPLKIGG